jgi:hypothetical protein
MQKNAIGALALACAAIGGCTTYMPAPSPRIAEVSTGYVKDGTVTRYGAFGGALVDLVAGNPEAEAHARKYRGLMIGGFVCDLAFAGLVSGAATEFATDPTQSPGAPTIGYGLIGGAAAMLGVAILLQTIAQADKLDAINLYNDGVSKAPAPPLPVAPPPPPSGALAPRRETTADVLLR